MPPVTPPSPPAPSQFIYYIGGQDSSGDALATTEYIDLSTGAVADGPSMGTARWDVSCVAMEGNTALATAGYTGNARLTTIEQLPLQSSDSWSTWSSGLTVSRNHHGAAVDGTDVYIFGGQQDGTFTASVERCNSTSCISRAPLPSARKSVRAAKLGDYLYDLGGITSVSYTHLTLPTKA